MSLVRMLYKDANIIIQMSTMNITDVTSKLKFIGKIKKGEKIDVGKMCAYPNTFFSRIYRTLFSIENRNITYDFIETTINYAFEIISVQHNSFSVKKQKINIATDLSLAIDGVINLKNTYDDDKFFCCRLDALVESIRLKLEQVNPNKEDNKEDSDTDIE